MTLAERWELFRRECLHPEALPAHVELIRQTFFAGALSYHQAEDELMELSYDVWEEHQEALESELLACCKEIIQS
jgi:hypothetical protein